MPPPPIPKANSPKSPGPPPIPKLAAVAGGEDVTGDSFRKYRSAEGTISLDTLFGEIDKGGDGYITFSEFVRWWKNKDDTSGGHTLTDELLSEAMTKFHEQDLDGNGSISPDELAGLVKALDMHNTIMKGQIDLADLDLPPKEEVEEKELEEEMDGTPEAEPEPEPAAPEPKHRKLKTFYAKQNIWPAKPETIQLAVGSMSVMAMYHGQTIETFPYIVLKNWGKTENTFWLQSCNFEDDTATRFEFGTAEGKTISDLMVTQAQEMAKLMKPGQQTKGSVGWDDLVYEIKIHTGDSRGVAVGKRTVHLELEGDQGTSGKLVMPQKDQTGRAYFQRAQVDSFTIKLRPKALDVAAGHETNFATSDKNIAYLPSRVTELGAVRKLTIGHDGNARGAGWDFKKLVVINVRTHEKVEFLWKGNPLERSAGLDPTVEIVIPDDEGGEVVVVDEEQTVLEALAIDKEPVVGTYRALKQAKMREDIEGNGKIVGGLHELDIVECFEQKTNANGQERLRVLSPEGKMGWVSFIAKDGTKIFKTTTSWGAYRDNAEGDGCSGWLEKKGGMRTNWQKRWFHLVDFTLAYFETNKNGVGKSEKGKIDLKLVEEVKHSTAPGATEFEIELVTDGRTFRMRAPNKPEFDHWMARLQYFAD